MQIKTHSAEETEALGRRLASVRPGDTSALAVLWLTGELGAGKTSFVQGLVRGLGASVRATSPTFVLVNEYAGRVPIHHVDAYRTESMTELMDLGLLEMIGGDGVTIVEWADKLTPLLPPDAIHVHITGVGDELRTITIRS